MSQSTGSGTNFFSPLINFGTDVLVLVLVLVQFSSTDSVLVLIAQVLSTDRVLQILSKNIGGHEVFKNISDYLFKFQFQTQKFKIAPLNLNFPHEKLIFPSENFKFLVKICCTGTD